MKFFLAVLMAGTLAACSGGGGADPANVVQTPDAPVVTASDIDALYASSFVVGVERLPAETQAAAIARLTGLVEGFGGGVNRAFNYIPFVVADLPNKAAVAAAEIALEAGVLSSLERNDLHAPALNQARSVVVRPSFDARGFTGDGQVIAVLDTGVDNTHEMLRDRVVDEACFTGINPSCPNGLGEQYGEGAAKPCNDAVRGSFACSHGTHVAGIAAGTSDEMSGVATTAGIMAINIFGYYPLTDLRTSRANIIEGLEYVYSKRGEFDIAAVNMSLSGDASTARGWNDPFGCSDDNQSVQAAVQLLNDVEIAVVAAAGNNGNDGELGHPACLPEVISVGSVGRDNTISEFSNSASFLDIFAPGEEIVSAITTFDGPAGYDEKSGTSMAAPFVAGAFAAMRSEQPNATVLDLLGQMQSHSFWTFDRDGYYIPILQLQ